MAAASQLTILSPKPRTLHVCRASSGAPFSNFRKQVVGVAAGILAATAVAAATPLEADATRIEYYATFSEPSCELNFVKSGLGYCDVVLGSGVEVPFAELINVSFLILLSKCLLILNPLSDLK